MAENRISPAEKNSAVYTILLLSVVYWTGISIQMTTDPFITKDLKLDNMYFGYIQTALAASQMIGNPIYSNLCGKYLKTALVLAFASSALSFFITSVSNGFTMLLVSRLVCCMAQGPIGLQTAISVISTKEERTEMFSKLGATFGIGFISGAFLGGVLADLIGYYYPCALVGVATVLVIPLIYKFIPDQLSEASEQDSAKESPGLLFEYIRLLKMKKVAVFVLTKNVCMLPLMMFMIIFGVYLVDTYGISPGQNAVMSVFSGVCMTLTNAVGIGVLKSRYTETTLVHVGCAMVMATGLCLALVSQYWHFFIVAALMACSMTLVGTICDSLLTMSVSASDQALAVGLIWAMDSVLRLLSPTAATLMLSHLGFVSFGLTTMLCTTIAWLIFYSHQISLSTKVD